MASTAPLIDAEQSLRLLAEQGELLAATPEAALGEPVPAVPGWTVEDVVRHTARGDRWVASILREGPEADVGRLARSLESSPHGPESLANYRDSLDGLLAEFGRRDLADPAATFVGPRTAGWWARRRACENVIHRHDAQSAHQSSPEPVEPIAAADGVDEWAQVIVPSLGLRGKSPVPEAISGKRLALVASDVSGARWTISARQTLDGSRSDEAADATATLSAWELFLTAWRRKPLASPAVTGESPVAQGFYDYIRI